ncbi:MAG: lipid IV(A) 3-deoxy-D-manno-octulosonic acid transferase [Gallionellaceae bacterium]|jgi:3-deoxy-D-manno-octulosonic-acid transferase
MLNPRFIYTAVLWLLLPYVLFHLLWRARKQPEYLQHIPERFGFFPIRVNKPVIWLHTVSVGETRAAASLIQRLAKIYPTHQILLTHTTPTGRAASEQLYGDRVKRVYLPYDYPSAVRSFLRHFKPAIGILLETEIWFNLIHFCRENNTPLLLLNARLSEKSASRYARFPKLTQQGLHELTSIAAQTREDAARLQTLGAPSVSIMGNLKFDIVPPAAMLELGKQLREQLGNYRNIFLAASTREGEEALLLDELKNLAIPNLLTIIVPRHPQRFDEVATLIQQAGFSYQRRSQNIEVSADTKIILGDSMGEMFAYYTACDIAFIGGSLLPFGAQNLIEACAVGKPVLIGPHTYNFSQAAEQAIACGAAKRVHNAFELCSVLAELFSDEAGRNLMAQAGLHFVEENQGATHIALQQIAIALK